MNKQILKLIKNYEKGCDEIYKSLPSYTNFKNEKLAEFDNSAIGTIAELKKKRESLELSLKEEYNKIKKDKMEILSKEKENFKNEIFKEAYNCDDIEVCEKIWAKAYAEGHGAGMYEIVQTFFDLDEFVYEIISKE